MGKVGVVDVSGGADLKRVGFWVVVVKDEDNRGSCHAIPDRWLWLEKKTWYGLCRSGCGANDDSRWADFGPITVAGWLGRTCLPAWARLGLLLGRYCSGLAQSAVISQFDRPAHC